MFDHQENEVDSSEGSDTESRIMDVSGDASMDFLDEKLNKTKKIKLLEEGGDHANEAPRRCQDSRTRFCKYCSREFKSDKALGGHLRIHMQHKKAAIKHSPEATKEEDNDDSFSCFACGDSFSSMKLLCQHMRKHRDIDSNGVQEPIASQESRSLSPSEPETSFDQGMNDQNQGYCIDFLKDITSWSRTGKRLRKNHSDKIDNIIYNAVPLSVYYGSAVPQIEKKVEDSQEPGMNKKKKKKIEENLPNQYASVELPTTKNISTCFSNKSKSSSSRERLLKNPNRAKAVIKSTVHECEICGKRFETGQALGGHKTYHRLKPVVVPLAGNKLVQRKVEEELCGGSGEIREYVVTRMLFPGVPSGDQSEEADHQQHPKSPRLLDFDLNIPYQE